MHSWKQETLPKLSENEKTIGKWFLYISVFVVSKRWEERVFFPKGNYSHELQINIYLSLHAVHSIDFTSLWLILRHSHQIIGLQLDYWQVLWKKRNGCSAVEELRIYRVSWNAVSDNILTFNMFGLCKTSPRVYWYILKWLFRESMSKETVCLFRSNIQ